MAKRKIEDYEARDAMNTLMRAREIEADRDLMTAAQKSAADHAAKMSDVARRAGALAKAGHISDKQLAKLKKDKPLASGKEGDTGKGQTVRGIATK